MAILNFQFHHMEDWPIDKYHSSYRLREDTSHEIMTDVLRFVFLELGRFKKRIWELESVFDKWMYLLKHMHEMVNIPDEFNEPVFNRLFLLGEIDNFTAEEYKQYQKSLETMSELDNVIDSTAMLAEKRGRELGLAEGRSEGSYNKSIEIAKNMLSMSIDIETIAKATGLSVEEISKI